MSKVSDLEDGSNCPDWTAFLGKYMAVGAGATVGGTTNRSRPRAGFGMWGAGASVSISQFGSVNTGIEAPQANTIGRDLSITGSIGVTFVQVIETKECCAKP
jgi:hypothetical protein